MSDVTLADFIKEYLEHRRANREEATVRLNAAALNKLKDHVGTKIMNMITPRDIDAFHDNVLMMGCRPTSLNAYIRHLNDAFKTALKWQYITQDHYAEVKQVSEPEKYDRVLHDDEMMTTERLVRQDSQLRALW